MAAWGRKGFVYLRFNSISRFSAECDRLVPPVPKTRLTFVRTKSRAVSVSLFFIRLLKKSIWIIWNGERNEWSNKLRFDCFRISGLEEERFDVMELNSRTSHLVVKLFLTTTKRTFYDKICNSLSYLNVYSNSDNITNNTWRFQLDHNH